MAILIEPLHQDEHVINMRRCPRQHIGHLYVQAIQIFQELAGIKSSVFLKALTRLLQSSNDLVVDVGDVHRISDFVPEVLQVPLKNVDSNESPEVANMNM